MSEITTLTQATEALRTAIEMGERERSYRNSVTLLGVVTVLTLVSLIALVIVL